MTKEGVQFKSEFSIDELIAAVVTTAKAVGAYYDEPKLQATLIALADIFESSAVGYRTTTRNPRTINTRYFNLTVPHDPFQIVLDRGLLRQDNHPCMQIFPYIMENFPPVGNTAGSGIDVGSAWGVEKIWVFMDPSESLSRILEIPGLPDSVHNNETLLRELGLDTIRVLGVDFRAKSVNLYFMAWEIPGGLSPANVRRFIEAPGFTVPSEEFVTASCIAMCPYYTFSYQTDEIQRISFASHIPDSSLIPIFDPIMKTFINNAVTTEQAKQRLFYFNPTVARENWYTKIEMDFNERSVEELVAIIPQSFIEQAARQHNQ